MITITKMETNSRVAVSCGSRRPKRMQPSFAWTDPATITSPSTSSALAKIEPIREVWATTTSPEPEREHDDEELGQVAEGRLHEARDGRAKPEPDLLGGQCDHPREPGERRRRGREGGHRAAAGVAKDTREGRNRGSCRQKTLLPASHGGETFIFWRQL